MTWIFVGLSALVVIVSSCSEGEFECKPGECISAALRCDFKTDCENGLDEEFCGSCTFEHHSCGWSDTSGGSYQWRREKANITSPPGVDHTSGNQSGYVMHVNKKQNTQYSGTVKMEYSLGQTPALGCQISFWYFIIDDWTSRIKLTVIGDSNSLLEVVETQSTAWTEASAFVGNRPKGSTLKLSTDPPLISTPVIMLDDIKFENCADGDVLEGSDQLSCGFDSDTCSWYDDYTAGILWKRDSDALDKDGFCMSIKARGSKVSSAARLISFPQAAGQNLCVSFWYQIFGNSIGSLKFITKYSDEEERTVWIRTGTQGNKWRFTDLTFSSTKPIQFIIEAVVGGSQGRIAIDDIVVYNSTSGSCPPERECTFQGSLCGLLPQPAASFSWKRVTGASQPANSSGPASDHTLGTDQGFYLSAQLWNHPVEARGAMMTAVMEPSGSEEECLIFWYYMEGSDVGELNIYLKTIKDSRESVPIWTRKGNQGKHWRHARATLRSNAPYQVIFEAVVGTGARRDVAIDDLTVLDGPCLPTGFCDFEMDVCGWVNSHPVQSQSGVDWDWLSGESEGQLIPDQDHSTDTALGHFVSFMPMNEDEQQIARLESETMDAVERACLEMWYCVEGFLSSGYSNIQLLVFVNESDGLRPVLNKYGYMNNSWIQEKVNYSAKGPHQLILQANCSCDRETISLDDIYVIRDKFCDELTPTTTPNPPTTTGPPPSAMDCTFEEGLCSWVQEVSNDVNWTRSMGLQAQDQPWDGPQYDHTVGNNEGFFLLLYGSGSKAGERAAVSLPLLEVTTEQICVGFWYHMLGPSVSTLDLLLKTNSSEDVVWTRRGTQNPEWIHAEVTVSTEDVSRLMFAAHRSTTSKGFIAIDDITVRQGPCGDQNGCGFDNDLCGFVSSVTHKGKWIHERATEEEVDHSYGTDHGFYVTVSGTVTEETTAQLLTPDLAPKTEMCVRFWYWLPAGSSDSLTVHVLLNGELSGALWQHSGVLSSGWEVAEVNVSSHAEFRVVFQTTYSPDTGKKVKVDDVSWKTGACRPPGSCDFESGQCNFLNVRREDGHDWVLANGGFQGPETDHTTQTPDGWFLLSSSQHRNHNSVTQVLSEWIQPSETVCFSLWYHMKSSDSGTLRVYLRSGPSEDQLLFHSNSSGSRWTRLSQSVPTIRPFQLLIEAETNNRGFIAVDDLVVSPGICQANDTSLEFVGCSFENGTCGWEDNSLGQSKWTRGRNASENLGPTTDHTVGTEFGWYMALAPNKGEEISPAALQSPTMKQASTSCSLHFYYNTYGEDEAKLNVVMIEGTQATTLWWQSGSHEDVWQAAVVTVGRMPQDFSITFEGSRTFNKPGHVAIDDITFSNCSLPEPQPVCPDTMFRCNNSVCVESKHLCDYSDDCGDRSDENDCELKGFVERCSFEQGLCSWAESDVDTLHAKWTRQRGEEAWPSLGPGRDHTQNSAAGHYVIPGSQTTKMSETSEMLSTTLLPSINCTVRFYLFRLEDASGTLTVQSRTLRSGANDAVLWLNGMSNSYSWQRAEATFSTSGNSKIVFRYKSGRGLVAVDDISFSRGCVFDPKNSNLPDTSPTSSPTTTTGPAHPCQDDEFSCWRSAGNVCVLPTQQCDYLADCPLGEDEDGCGPCTFEWDQCQWNDTGGRPLKWQRQKASHGTIPPSDHTTNTGFYVRVNFSQGSTQSDARLQSPQLPPSSPYCQILFHFYISPKSAGSLRVLMQQAEGSEAILWSRSDSTLSNWIPEYLPIGLHQQPYKIWFSGLQNANTTTGDHVLAVDDISFLNCEKSYKAPAPSTCSCSFEDGLCVWVQGAEDQLDWISGSGPTETPNTGPAVDHTTGKGKYLYINSSSPSVRGHVAQLKSPLLPPTGDVGYCFTFWHHMFGATVGSLRMLLQTTEPRNKTTVWQKSGNQGDEWQLVQIHVTVQSVHQVILEATVGGEAGDIAIDDISLTNGPCSASDLCDFEEGSCGWQQQTDDDFDWVRQSGPGQNPNTGPDSDHSTNAPEGHYYYLPSSNADRAGQTAKMSSPLYPSGKGSCVQLWYHMYGGGVGTLNVYQQAEGQTPALLFSQMGDQGQLWRFAQAGLFFHDRPYRIMVEGVKAGPTQVGDMAFDDVMLADVQCPSPGHCDFEINMCGWSNLGGVDEEDWLRGRGISAKPNTGPSVDHTTNSPQGYYLYVDSSVGEWGNRAFLISDVFHPSTRGHCLTFWYHMNGDHVGTLRVFTNDRKMHDAGNDEGTLKWMESQNQGDGWREARVYIRHEEPFWFVFVYQRGSTPRGDIALDDITVVPGDCYPPPPTRRPDGNDHLTVGLPVGLSLLAGLIICVVLYVLNRKQKTKSQETILFNEEPTARNSVFDLVDGKIDGTDDGTVDHFSFYNQLYDRSSNRSKPGTDA